MANPSYRADKPTLPAIIRWPLKLLAIAWASPYTAFGCFVGVVGLCSGGKARFRDGAIEFHSGGVEWLLRKVTGFASAMTWGHVILGRSDDLLDACASHERVHVRQYERWGPFFGPAYLLGSAWAWAKGKRPYYDNPFEREAYEDDARRRREAE